MPLFLQQQYQRHRGKSHDGAACHFQRPVGRVGDQAFDDAAGDEIKRHVFPHERFGRG